MKKNTPPFSQEAEASVLAAVLLDGAALATVATLLRPDDFYSQQFRLIFEAMLGLFREGKPIDTLTLSDRLGSMGKMEAAGGPAMLSQLAGSVSTAANIEFWCKIVKDKSTLRALILAASAIVAGAQNDPEDVPAFADEAGARIIKATTTEGRTAYRLAGDIANDVYFKLGEEDSGAALPTGLASLDALISGLRRKDLTLLAGRPSMGKTALALAVVTHAALDLSASVGFFSLEMSGQSLLRRVLCSMAAVELDKLEGRGELTAQDRVELVRAVEWLRGTRLLVDDSPGLTLLQVRARSMRMKAEHGLDLIVVDHLGLIREGKARESREQVVSEISKGLKTLAKELDVPVLALSQLNRACEGREDKRPRLADLRDSGSLEQDADQVLLLFRPGYYNLKVNPRGMEAIIAKQRNGRTGSIDLDFELSTQRITAKAKGVSRNVA
jgi:replicative DNA helicase